VTWREGTKGRCRRASPPNVWSAQDDLVIPRSGSGLAAHGMAAWREGSDGLYRDQVAGEHVTAPARSESQAAVAHRTVYEDAKGELGLDHYEGRSFRGWNHHVSMVLVCFAFIVAERSRAFPLGRKTATRKASHRHDGADGNPPERHFRDSFIHCAPAVARVLAHGYPDAPCVTDRDRWTAWCTCP